MMIAGFYHHKNKRPWLTPEEENQIRKRYLSGVGRKKIMKEFNIAYSTISRVCKGLSDKRKVSILKKIKEKSFISDECNFNIGGFSSDNNIKSGNVSINCNIPELNISVEISTTNEEYIELIRKVISKILKEKL